MNDIFYSDIIIINKKIKKITKLLNNKNICSNKKKYLYFISKYNYLNKIIYYYNNWKKYCNELNNLKSLINDVELCNIARKEMFQLNILINNCYKKLNIFFLKNNKNINNNKDILNAYIEIHSATGGNESSLFVLDLFKMYTKYSNLMKWKIELININESVLNGYKLILFKVIGNGVYGKLKYESGGHRVQRVPITDSKGRVHTSTCKVAVIPDVPVKDLPIINNEDIKVDTFRSSGAGGQHVNTTDSAVRLTHIPTGIIVECQQERSQHKNKSKALEVLKARIYSFELNKRHKKESDNKKKLLGSGFRCDRNRTYNFIQNRITDHRINLTLYSLNEILNGNLNLLINPLINFYNKK